MADVLGSVQMGRSEGLLAIRDRLAEEMEASYCSECKQAPNLAALAKQLVAVLEQIEATAPAKEEDPLDDLRARRAAKAPVPNAGRRKGVGRG